ncbi:MAG: cytochrome P450 [Actinomycetota bacterium]
MGASTATDEAADSTASVVPAAEADLPTIGMDGPIEDDEIRARMNAVAAEHWIARTPVGYVILRYGDVLGILRDKRWHNAAAKAAELAGITDPDYLAEAEGRVSILSAEGDVHVRLRRLVAKSFSPRSADRLRPFMRDVVNDLIDAVASTGRADIVSDICEPYPIPIICELLGAPKQDWKLFSKWAEDVLRIFNGTAADELDVIRAAQRDLDDYTRTMIAERRDDPRDDLLTDLIAAEEEGDRLSTDELVMMVNAVIVGGTDTTRNQLGCAVAVFAEHPEQWRLLAERPEMAPRAVEEVMRHSGAIRGTGRFASEEIEYGGLAFAPGTMVMPSLALGNRDGTAFEAPERFDITKEPAEQPHLTFGSGIHYCLGASLARAELQEALPLLAQRMPDLEVDGEVTWKPSTTAIFGPARLPVTFAPH